MNQEATTDDNVVAGQLWKLAGIIIAATAVVVALGLFWRAALWMFP